MEIHALTQYQIDNMAAWRRNMFQATLEHRIWTVPSQCTLPITLKGKDSTGKVNCYYQDENIL